MKTVPLVVTALACFCNAIDAASVVVNWSTDRAFIDAVYSKLSAGTPADGDGALLQLGYFSLATPSDPFAGTWMVLDVESVGDQGGLEDGLFSITTILEEGTFAAPAPGTPLGVRFFDGLTIEDSFFYNTGVNDDGTGLWVAPADPAPVINLALSKSVSDFEGAGSWQTHIPVPEPSIPLLGCFVLGWLTARRRRSR